MKKIIILLLIALIIHSCALLTSNKKFSIERKPEFSLLNTMAFSDKFNYSIIFYDDGSCLYIRGIDLDEIDDYLEKINYDIYKKFSGDYWFHWGVYKAHEDTVKLEFLDKIDQWGVMGICRWTAVLENEILTILPGPENRRHNEQKFIIPRKQINLHRTDALDSIKIDPTKAWINK